MKTNLLKSMGSSLTLYSWQKKAISQLHSGSLLYGGVGSGKTLTALVFYKKNYGHLPLIVITTAKKRDSGDWEDEAKLAGVASLTVDSWNNILEYKNVENTFFIFDEQRVVGYGSWSKTFIHISKSNPWIMLTATPGDTWHDYLTVFIANGFYRNKTDFESQHVEYDRFAKFPKIKAYHNQSKLQAERQQILVSMRMVRKTERERILLVTDYNTEMYKFVTKSRVNIYKENQPIKTPGEYTQVVRRMVALSKGRQQQAERLMTKVDKLIVFYNYDYERKALIDLCEKDSLVYSQWNGHKHEAIPQESSWVYLVQYTAGAEGWNCTETDSVMFYSPNYSYKIMEQSEGRIDRLNTKFTHLKYYYLQSASPIDRAVFKAIEKKRRFNASAWAKEVVGLGVGEQISGRVGRGYSFAASPFYRA